MLLVFGHPQADDLVHQLEQSERQHERVRRADHDSHELHEQLVGPMEEPVRAVRS